jgi:hypothetical protein
MSFQIDATQSEAASRELQALLSRSATDWDFRQKLISDAPQALAEYAGRHVPGSENFRFLENEADATFVLPDPIRDGTLDEAELEAVSGGITFVAAVAYGITLGLALHALQCDEHG